MSLQNMKYCNVLTLKAVENKYTNKRYLEGWKNSQMIGIFIHTNYDWNEIFFYLDGSKSIQIGFGVYLTNWFAKLLLAWGNVLLNSNFKLENKKDDRHKPCFGVVGVGIHFD